MQYISKHSLFYILVTVCQCVCIIICECIHKLAHDYSFMAIFIFHYVLYLGIVLFILKSFQYFVYCLTYFIYKLAHDYSFWLYLSSVTYCILALFCLSYCCFSNFVNCLTYFDIVMYLYISTLPLFLYNYSRIFVL